VRALPLVPSRSLMAKGKGKKEQGQQQAQGGEQKKK